jgi:feruloyl-CoA synthase
VVGADKAFVGALIFPNLARCKEIAGIREDASPTEILTRSNVREAFEAALADYNRRSSGSSRHVARAVVLDEDPRVYEAELTDKHYLNQRRAAARREAVVEGLFGPDPPPAAIVFQQSRR